MIKAYFEALFANIVVLGGLFFLYSAFWGSSPLAAYLVYVSLFAATAGPIRVLIDRRTTQ